MSLLTLRNLTVAFGDKPVLKEAQLSIAPRERICVIGRNGEGKSTLMRIIAGEVEPDVVEFEKVNSLRVAKLDQSASTEQNGTAMDIVLSGAGEASKLLIEYHKLLNQSDEKSLNKLTDIQAQLDASDGWKLEAEAQKHLTQLGVDPEASFDDLSGGGRRRALLARALISNPDILLLDEPTNHLDLPSINWLEQFLLKINIAIVFVTHDRALMRSLATRIVDIDRGKLISWDCDYDTYLTRKAEWLEAEEARNAEFDKKLAREEAWIRQGIKARRTRNEGRVRALKKLRVERAERRKRQGAANLETQDANTSGRKVITAKNVSYSWDKQPIVDNLNTTLWRGDKIGIVGANGTGKTTLLRLLLKELEPQEGSVTHGTKLEIAYLDQHRNSLDLDKTVAENVCPSGDHVYFNGRSVHVYTYLQNFLFSPESAKAPIRKLSGGESARLLLAKLFTQKANLLVLDEPTNDLDVETVELLEELLVEFDGTILLVSHDRDFLDNVVTQSLVLDGKGNVSEYYGGTEEWLHGHITPSDVSRKERQKEAPPATTAPTPMAKAKKLSNKEREELKAMPQTIEQLEANHGQLVEDVAKPEFYQETGLSAEQAAEKLSALEKEIETTYERWEALEARA